MLIQSETGRPPRIMRGLLTGILLSILLWISVALLFNWLS